MEGKMDVYKLTGTPLKLTIHTQKNLMVINKIF